MKTLRNIVLVIVLAALSAWCGLAFGQPPNTLPGVRLGDPVYCVGPGYCPGDPTLGIPGLMSQGRIEVTVKPCECRQGWSQNWGWSGAQGAGGLWRNQMMAACSYLSGVPIGEIDVQYPTIRLVVTAPNSNVLQDVCPPVTVAMSGKPPTIQYFTTLPLILTTIPAGYRWATVHDTNAPDGCECVDPSGCYANGMFVAGYGQQLPGADQPQLCYPGGPTNGCVTTPGGEIVNTADAVVSGQTCQNQ